MRISFLLLASILALFYTLQAKKCCNPDCSQVISQGRSFREHIPEEIDGLPLERDVKVWVFMKEMGVNGEGDEMWYGESRGKKGFFPKQLIGEYMVLCRDLIEVVDWQETDDYTPEDVNEVENESQIEPEIEENTIEQEILHVDKFETLTPEPIETQEFHAPDTVSMNKLKQQMDQDFLNRILESEGVESIDEIEAERYTEILSDPVAARVIMEALEAAREPELPPLTQDHLDTPVSEEVSTDTPPEAQTLEPPSQETGDIPFDNPDEYWSDYSSDDELPYEGDGDTEDREITQSEYTHDTHEENNPEDVEDREITQPEYTHDTHEENNPEDVEDREIIQSEYTHDIPEENNPENVEDRETSQPEDSQDINEDITPEDVTPVIEDTNDEISHQETTVDPVEPIEQDYDVDQNREVPDSHKDVSLDEEISEQTGEEEQTNEDTRLFGFLPSPLSDIIREYVRTYGIFYITVYTMIPLLITHLYWSRGSARKEVDKQKILASNHFKTLEQKVTTLQKEKKTFESKIAKHNTTREENAEAQGELFTLRTNFEANKQDLENKTCYITQLESDSTQCNAELVSTQNTLNEKCIQVDRLETLNASAQEEILSLNGKIDGLNEQMRQTDTEKLTLQLRLDANIDSFAELKEKLAGVEKSRDEVEHKKSVLQGDLKQKEVKIFASSDRIHTLEGEIEVLTKSLLKLKPEAVGKSKVSDSEVKSIFETLTNTAKAISELEHMTESKERFEIQNKLLTGENVSLKAKCEDLDDNLSCVKSSNILLKKQMGDSDTKLQVLNEYFNTKESELHRQLNESRNSQLLLEGKDHRSHDEIDSVRSEREGLKTEVTELKQQHSQREKSLLEQISSLEKRVQENLYNSRRSEQEIRWRDREITELKRKLGESSLPSSQLESYISPRSTSPSSQFSSNSDSEAKVDKNRTSQSPSQAQFTSAVQSLPTFTSGPPTRVDMPPIVSVAQTKPPLMPGFHPNYMPPPPNFYAPGPFPPMFPPFGPRQVMSQNMTHYNSPTVPMKQKPTARPANTSQDLTETSSQPSSQPANRPAPEYYAPSPPTLMDTPPNQDYTQPESSPEAYNGSLLDSQNSSTPTQKEASAFLIDV